MKLDEFMAPQQAAQALTGQDDAARRAQGVQPRAAAVKQAAAAIDAEQKSADPLDKRIAQARNVLAQLLQQKQRQQQSQQQQPAQAQQPQQAQQGQQPGQQQQQQAAPTGMAQAPNTP